MVEHAIGAFFTTPVRVSFGVRAWGRLDAIGADFGMQKSAAKNVEKALHPQVEPPKLIGIKTGTVLALVGE